MASLLTVGGGLFHVSMLLIYGKRGMLGLQIKPAKKMLKLD
jgi:hypothetical protein